MADPDPPLPLTVEARAVLALLGLTEPPLEPTEAGAALKLIRLNRALVTRIATLNALLANLPGPLPDLVDLGPFGGVIWAPPPPTVTVGSVPPAAPFAMPADPGGPTLRERQAGGRSVGSTFDRAEDEPRSTWVRQPDGSFTSDDGRTYDPVDREGAELNAAIDRAEAGARLRDEDPVLDPDPDGPGDAARQELGAAAEDTARRTDLRALSSARRTGETARWAAVRAASEACTKATAAGMPGPALDWARVVAMLTSGSTGWGDL